MKASTHRVLCSSCKCGKLPEIFWKEIFTEVSSIVYQGADSCCCCCFHFGEKTLVSPRSGGSWCGQSKQPVGESALMQSRIFFSALLCVEWEQAGCDEWNCLEGGRRGEVHIHIHLVDFHSSKGGTERHKQWMGADISLKKYETKCLSLDTAYFYNCILWI